MWPLGSYSTNEKNPALFSLYSILGTICESVTGCTCTLYGVRLSRTGQLHASQPPGCLYDDRWKQCRKNCWWINIPRRLLSSPQPKVVTDTDETELARQLERLERENAEVDGDDDAEEMEAKAED